MEDAAIHYFSVSYHFGFHTLWELKTSRNHTLFSNPMLLPNRGIGSIGLNLLQPFVKVLNLCLENELQAPLYIAVRRELDWVVVTHQAMNIPEKSVVRRCIEISTGKSGLSKPLISCHYLDLRLIRYAPQDCPHLEGKLRSQSFLKKYCKASKDLRTF